MHLFFPWLAIVNSVCRINKSLTHKPKRFQCLTLFNTLWIGRVTFSVSFNRGKTALISTHLLTHWGWVTHICISKLTITGSDNGLSPGRRQVINWTNAGILLIWTLGINCSEILSKIHTFSFKKMNLKMPSVKWQQFRLGLNVSLDFF